MPMAYYPTSTIHLSQMGLEKNVKHNIYAMSQDFFVLRGTTWDDIMMCANSSIRKTIWSQSPYWGSFLKLTMIHVPINSQENNDHTEPYVPKLLLLYNFGMKLKSAHLILILDHAPTPTTPSKQIPTFLLNNLLGGKAEGSEAMSGPRFLSWKMSTSRKTHMEPPKLIPWKPDFLKTNRLKISTVFERNSLRIPPALVLSITPILKVSKPRNCHENAKQWR